MIRTIGLDISVLSDKQRTGIAVYAYNLIDALLKINQKDRFLLFGIATFDTFNYLKNLPFKNYPNVDMKIYRMPARAFRTAFLLWQKIEWPPIETFTGRVDIFHSFNWYFPPQRAGKKVASVFDMTSITHPYWHDPRTSQLDNIRLSRMSETADLVIAISKNSQKDFLKVYPQSRVEVIYPAACQFPKNNKLKTQEVLRKYSLSPGFILSVSTLEPRKNLKALIKAYLDSGLKRPLVLVGGQGWKNQQTAELVNKYPGRIKLTGFVPDEQLPVFYRHAFCLVYPSFYEGFGIPPLEAMSVGTPVIMSNTSSLPEVGGDAALYINPGNINEIKSALILLEQEPDLRKDLIRKGFAQVAKFSWKKSAEKLNFLYRGLLE